MIYKTNDNCNAIGWLIPYYPEAYYSVQRFYSQTNSFVKIKPEPEVLRCGQRKSITVHYILNKKAYGKATSIKFYYVVSVVWLLCFPERILSGICPEKNPSTDFSSDCYPELWRAQILSLPALP